VTDGTTYYDEVSDVNGVGQGPRSNEVMATPSAPDQAPTITSSAAVTAEVRQAVTFT
jgi:hypothetical protein